MWTLAIRTWFRRWGSGTLVLLELAIGFFCLTMAASTMFTMTAVVRKVSAFASLQTRIVGTYKCPPAQLDSGLTKLRRSFDVGAFYIKGPNDIAIDAPTAELFPLKVSNGRWLRSLDFVAESDTVPAVLGFSIHPELSIGNTIPGTNRVIVGRLLKGQTFMIPNLAVLDSIVSTDKLVLTPTNREPISNINRFVVLPKLGQAASASEVPSEFTSCLNGSSTLQQELNGYYKSRRPLMIVMGFVALVILTVATLGFVGIAMMTMEKRTREFAIRLTVGATKADLMLQLLGEMLLLSLVASLISTPAAWVAGQAVNLTVSASLMILVNALGALLGLIAAAGPMVIMLRRPPVFFIRGGR